VGVLVVVDEREFELATVGQDEDPGLPAQLVLRDPDRGVHSAVGSLLGVPDAPGPE
jgi:hypothetical protein